MEMVIIIEQGINGNGFTIKVNEDPETIRFQKSYRYGYDASYDKWMAEAARRDHENALRYGWSRVPSLKPYVRDIIDLLCAEYGIEKDQVRCRAGKCVFRGRNVTEKDVKDFVSKYVA